MQFQPYLQALHEAAFDGAVSIELEYSPEPAKIVEWVREAYQARPPTWHRWEFGIKGGN